MRAFAGHFQYQERLEQLSPPSTAYGLLMAVRTAKHYGIDSIAVAEFGVANGRGLKRMASLADRLARQSGVDIAVYGFDTGEGLPPIRDFRDHPEHWATGDFPMQDIELLKSEIAGRAELIIGDIRDIPNLAKVIGGKPLGFASIDVDIYSSTIATLQLLAECPATALLPTVSLHFDDVWGRIHYSRFAGELLAIDEFSELHESRGIDIDRHVEFWHGGRKPWHASMYSLHTFDHPLRLNTIPRKSKVITAV
jgi:hypothetical protein